MIVPDQNLRVAILFHRIGPYHFARVRAAGRVFKTTLVEIYQGDDVYGWNLVPGADGFDRLTLFKKHPQPTKTVIKAIQTALDKFRPNVVAIPGWSDSVAFSALKWCITHCVPAVMMSESTEWDEQRSNWKEAIKRRLLAMCAAGLVGGRPHAEYLNRLGMSGDKIFQGYDAVDNGYFAAKAEESRKQKVEIRNKLRLPEKYFLASARFVEKKNLACLIEAYGRYRELAGNSALRTPHSALWDLVLLGDGPLRESLNHQLSTLNLQQHVHLPGFKQYDELPAYYGAASTFIHASTTEQWGLVVNEAMASGLPVLVSNRCGCAQDLVQVGVNGFTFDPCNAEDLAGLMFQISAFQPLRLSAFGSASREIISRWGPKRFAEGMSQAVGTALSGTLPKASLFDRFLLKLLLLR